MANGMDANAALRRATERGAKRTGVRAAAFLLVSAAAAVGAALLLARYLDARTAAARVPTVPVVVAALDLPETTELRPESVTVIQWPEGSVPMGAFSDPKAVLGRVLVTPLVKSEPVLAARLASAEAGRGLASLLPPGMRAVAVRVDDVVGVAGFIHPGDNVDVIVTLRPNENAGATAVSKIVLQNIRVLAVGKEIAGNDAKMDRSIPATVATLMVDSVESERLALAASRGELLLALRSGIDSAVVETSGVKPALLVGAPPPAPSPEGGAKRVARAAPPKKEEAPRQVVEILRGDLFERRDFEKKGGAR